MTDRREKLLYHKGAINESHIFQNDAHRFVEWAEFWRTAPNQLNSPRLQDSKEFLETRKALLDEVIDHFPCEDLLHLAASQRF